MTNEQNYGGVAINRDMALVMLIAWFLSVFPLILGFALAWFNGYKGKLDELNRFLTPDYVYVFLVTLINLIFYLIRVDKPGFSDRFFSILGIIGLLVLSTVMGILWASMKFGKVDGIGEEAREFLFRYSWAIAFGLIIIAALTIAYKYSKIKNQ